MDPKVVAEKPPADPLSAQKAAFDAAVKKTKAQDGLGPEPKGEKAAKPKPVEPKQEAKPAEKPEAPKEDPRIKEMASKLETLERQLSEQRKKAPEPEPKPERKSVAEGIRASLAEKFGEDEADTLSAAFGEIADGLIRRTEALEDFLKNAQERAKVSMSKTNRSKLGEQFPRLKESAEAWEYINRAAMDEMEKDHELTPDEAYEKVAKSVYGEQAKEKEVEDDEDEDLPEEIEASTMTTPERTKREKKLTPEEKSKAVFEILWKDPDNLVGAKRVARQLRVD